MSDLYFLNGKHVEINFPMRAVFYGDGIFETFRCRGKLPDFLDRHLSRLKAGAELLSIPFPPEHEIEEKISNAYDKSRINDAYMKVCLLPEGKNTFFEKPDSTSILITVRECTTTADPVSVCVSSYKRSQHSVLNTIKSLNYLENILVKREALDRGYHDAVILNQSGEVTETSSYNIFWIRGKGVFTPSVQCGLLPGITRELVLEVMKEVGYQINERRFGLSYMLNSDFVFLTNSVAGIVYVEMINDLKMPPVDDKFTHIRDSFYNKVGW